MAGLCGGQCFHVGRVQLALFYVGRVRGSPHGPCGGCCFYVGHVSEWFWGVLAAGSTSRTTHVLRAWSLAWLRACLLVVRIWLVAVAVCVCVFVLLFAWSLAWSLACLCVWLFVMCVLFVVSLVGWWLLTSFFFGLLLSVRLVVCFVYLAGCFCCGRWLLG